MTRLVSIDPVLCAWVTNGTMIDQTEPMGMGVGMGMLGSLGLVAFAELFDGLPKLMACAKDPDGCYVYSNQAFADRAGAKRVANVLGKRASDFFPLDLVELYEHQDATVLRTGKPLHDHLELISDPSGVLKWSTTSKVRLLNDAAKPVAILVVSSDAPGVETNSASLAALVSYVEANLGENLRVSDLAATAQLSTPQLDRQVRRVFGMSPRQLVQRLRFDEAMFRLSHGDQSIATIAAECGFFDQASFTKQFRGATGMTPGAYRNGHPIRRGSVR
jgi:AraC-like DNA-binding protein